MDFSLGVRKHTFRLERWREQASHKRAIKSDLCKFIHLRKRSVALRKNDIIRIHYKCQGGIEKNVPRITDGHHEACRVMTSGDHEGRIFLSHPHTNNGFVFLLTAKYRNLYWKKKQHEKRFQKSRIHWYATWWRRFNIEMTSRIDVRPARSRRAAVRFYLSLGLERVCEIG